MSSPGYRERVGRRALAVGACIVAVIAGASGAQAQSGVLLYAPNATSNSVSTYTANAGGTLTSTGTISVGTQPLAVAVRGDQAFAYVVNSSDNTVSVIDTATQAVVQTTPAAGFPQRAAISANGLRLYVASNSGAVILYDVNPSTGQLTQTATLATGLNQPRGLVLTPNGNTLYVNGASSANVGAIDTATNTVTTTIGVGNVPVGMAVNPAGTRVYVTNVGSSTVSVIDTASNTVIATVPTGSAPTGVVVAPDGAHWYVANQNNNTVSQFDTATNTAVAAPAATGQIPLGITVSPDGKTLYVANRGSDDRIEVFSIAPGTGVLTSIGTSAAGNDPTVLGICGNGNVLLASGATFVANTAGAIGCTGTTPTFTGGTLRMNAAGLSITRPLVLGTGGGTIDTNGNNATLSGAMTGATGLTKTGTGTLAAGAANVFSSSSSLTINGGTVDLNNFAQTIASLQGSGNVTLGSATLTIAPPVGNFPFSGAIGGTGGVTVAGSGPTSALNFSGANTYTGPTAVASGTLIVSGSLAAGSSVSVASGARLWGTGIAAGTVTVNGELGPGIATPGQFGTGSLIMNAGSTLSIDLNGPIVGTGYDRVNVTGTVTLANATLNLVAGYVPALGQVFTIIDNDGNDAVIGTFAGLAEGSAFTIGGVVYQISYAGGTGNDVTLKVITAPGAPTLTGVIPGNGQITVSFTAPASDGGSAITGYSATCGGATATGTLPSIVVGGLVNGSAYTCTVLAMNAAGNGPPSTASSSITPFTTPGAPTITAATPGNGRITLAFTAPSSNGSPITGFTAACAGITATGAGSPIVVTGLTNGTAYTCTVLATNAAGNGPPSGPSASVTPFTIAGAPSITTVSPGNGQIVVAFTPPASGGSPITGYTANCGGITATGAGSPITVTGLTNGTSYTCTVLATNAGGPGPASAPSASVTPFGVPAAPSITSVGPGNGQLVVGFTAPANNGSAITGYTASCGGITAAGPASPITVTGLTNRTPYVCTVYATNAAGNGPASAPSASATPVATSYTAASATGTGLITASFTGGGAGCSFSVSRFIPVTGDPASPPAAPSGVNFPHGLFDFTASGCTPGSTLTFTITYPAALPAGTPYWKYGPEPGNATPHWYVLPSTLAGNVTTFTITDGAQGDDDLAANGTIVDQGGPGVPGVPGSAVQVPTLSEWALAALALMILGATAGMRRRL